MKRIDPEFTYSEKEERRLFNIDMAKKRGKGTPKKGSGKRATKRKNSGHGTLANTVACKQHFVRASELLVMYVSLAVQMCPFQLRCLLALARAAVISAFGTWRLMAHCKPTAADLKRQESQKVLQYQLAAVTCHSPGCI
eukprot:12045-Heterococcus_DN1.PRE.1